METLIVHPDNKEKLVALKAVLKAMDIKFERSKSSYNPEFEAKIIQGDEDVKNCRTTRITLDDVWK